MATRLKSKAAAAANIPQSRTECAMAIRVLGDRQREFERLRADMNDRIAHVTAEFQPQLDALSDLISPLQTGIQTWCESHRVDLLGEADRLGKTADLVTGEVAWRQRPPSVRISGADAVCDTLLRMGLGRFVRVKNEPNKDAMLTEPQAVRGIAGITIVSGVEDFIISPREIDVQPTGSAA
jgi:phage host-nuclease inhibitor protein Gam